MVGKRRDGSPSPIGMMMHMHMAGSVHLKSVRGERRWTCKIYTASRCIVQGEGDNPTQAITSCWRRHERMTGATT